MKRQLTVVPQVAGRVLGLCAIGIGLVSMSVNTASSGRIAARGPGVTVMVFACRLRRRLVRESSSLEIPAGQTRR